MSETPNPSIQTDFRIQELTAEISKLQNTIESQKTEIERLNQILHNFQQHRFGAHSEKTKYMKTLKTIDSFQSLLSGMKDYLSIRYFIDRLRYVKSGCQGLSV